MENGMKKLFHISLCSEYQAVIKKLLDNLRGTDMSCSVRLFGLLTLGGIGKHRYSCGFFNGLTFI